MCPVPRVFTATVRRAASSATCASRCETGGRAKSEAADEFLARMSLAAVPGCDAIGGARMASSAAERELVSSAVLCLHVLLRINVDLFSVMTIV